MAVRLSRKMGCLLLGLSLSAGAGCGTAAVTGTVTYDGKPVAAGKITFLAADESGVAVGTDIEEGKYAIKELSPGKKRVYILAIPDGESQPVITRDLTAEITKGSQTVDFPLERTDKAKSSRD